MPKVFVSSTYLDLKDCRREVGIVLRKMGHEDVAMEYFTAEDKRPVDKCLEAVRECDLYLGIFAWRYGYIPKEKNPKKWSITEMEYREAVAQGKPRLLFLHNPEAPWPPTLVDSSRRRIEKLRAELQKKRTADHFTSKQDIGSVVTAAALKWSGSAGRSTTAAPPVPDFDVARYFEALQKRYHRLDLDALTPPQKEEFLQLELQSVFVEQSVRENPPPIELPKDVLERLEQDQEAVPPGWQRHVAAEDIRRARETYYQEKPCPVLEVLTDPARSRVVLLGDPGSGKSTLSRYVVLSLIDPAGDRKLRSNLEGFLPLVIELRSYSALCREKKCQSFGEFLEYLGKTEGLHLNHAALQSHFQNDGRAVIVFDGLDEIFDPAERQQVTRQIVGFSLDYPKVRVVVTSRIVGYNRKILTDAGFSHFTLQDLDQPQVQQFVEGWYSLALHDQPEEARHRIERIMESFQQ